MYAHYLLLLQFLTIHIDAKVGPAVSPNDIFNPLIHSYCFLN